MQPRRGGSRRLQFSNTTLAAADGILGQLIVPHVLTTVKALTTLRPLSAELRP